MIDLAAGYYSQRKTTLLVGDPQAVSGLSSKSSTVALRPLFAQRQWLDSPRLLYPPRRLLVPYPFQ